MKLEIGKRYRNGRGQIENVYGITRHYPDWVWTLQGNWYRQEDGRWIVTHPVRDDRGNLIDFNHVANDQPTGLDLIEEVK